MTQLRVAAVGDVSFNDRDGERPSLDVLSAVTPIFRASDVVIANLESPLLREGPSVPGKCALRGSPEWAEILKQAGVHIVSLANNHVMDFGEAGLASTVRALETAGIRYAGAGRNRKEANAPLFLECSGLRVAVLARTSVPVSSPSYATDTRPGVAFLEAEDTIAGIRHCKDRGALVIILLHWGVEEYRYPSAQQRLLARSLIEAGADLLVGHHPHVLQGVERFGTGLVSYSLGNFLFRDVHWSYSDADGHIRTEMSPLTEDNRRAGILTATLSGTGAQGYDFLPTRIQHDGTVVPEATTDRAEDFNRLRTRLRTPNYALFWQAYSLRQEWRMRVRPLVSGAFSPSKLRRLRLRHLKLLLTTLRRSSKIALEKTTNPYEG